MRTRSFVLIGIGLTMLSSLFLGLGQMFALYRGEIPDWTDFIRRYAWTPGFKIWDTIPHDIFDSTIKWFLLLLPGVLLLAVFHPYKRLQRIILGLLTLLMIIDLVWLLLGCGISIDSPNENYVAAFLHLGFSVLSLFSAVPLWLAIRQERRRDKHEVT